MNTPQPDRSIDYLNQIAPTTKKPLLPTKWLPLGLAALVLITLVISIVGLADSQPNLSSQVTALYARLQTLQTLSSGEQDSLQDTGLRGSNSSLTLLLNTSITDIGGYLKGSSQKFLIPQNLQQSEKAYLDTLSTKLNDARLNVELDSTYAREMAYQLSVVHTTMNSIARRDPSKPLLNILVDTNSKLEPLRQTFADFSGAKE